MQADVPVCLPHELFAYYWKHHTARFNEVFFGDYTTTSSRRAFWKELLARKDPRLVGHSMMGRDNGEDYASLVALHGDAVPVVKVGKPGNRSVEAWQICSLFANGVVALHQSIIVRAAY